MTTAKSITMVFPAKSEQLSQIRQKIGQVLAQILVGENAGMNCFQITLAVHEMCANIIEHAYQQTDGQIQIIIQLDDDRQQLMIQLIDNANHSFDPSIQQKNEHPFASRGRGLGLATQLMDEIVYMGSDQRVWQCRQGEKWQLLPEPAPIQEGNVWQLVKNLVGKPLSV